MITTPDVHQDEIRPHVVARLAPSAPLSKAGQPTKAEMARVRRYNLAIWRLIHGKGSMMEEISILTGLEFGAINRRCRRVEKHYTEEELNGQNGVFTDEEIKHLSRTYAHSKDPAVKAFMTNVVHGNRE